MKTAFEKIKYDLKAAREQDPAAKGNAEIILTYGGFHALVLHRFAHYMYTNHFHLIGKLVSSFAKFVTGIDIHPAAKIGYGVFIDHGVGVVIGETAIVGNYVTIYQGATLGGTGKDAGKRHPTIEDHVMICAGAKILGSFTVGHSAKVGAGSVVLHEVPANATVVGVPAKIVKLNGERCDDLDQDLPDPITEEITKLTARITALEEALKK